MLKKEARKLFVVFVVAFVLFLLIFTLFQPPIWCSCVDIDLNSGKCRDRTVVFGITIKSQIRDTDISKLISSNSQVTEPVWHKDMRRVEFFPQTCAGGRLIAACHYFQVTIELLKYQGVDTQQFIDQFTSYLRQADDKKIYNYAEELSEKYLTESE